MELSDIYDSRHNRTGRTMVRGEKLGEDDYIQAAAAVVYADGYVLVTKRHPDKTQGGMWEFPGGGSRSGEESVETLYRELEEETGIRAEKDQVTFLKTVYFAPYHLFLEVYLVETNVKMKQLKLQETEVVQAMLVTPEELNMMQPMFTKLDHQIYEEVVQELLEEKKHKI